MMDFKKIAVGLVAAATLVAAPLAANAQVYYAPAYAPAYYPPPPPVAYAAPVYGYAPGYYAQPPVVYDSGPYYGGYNGYDYGDVGLGLGLGVIAGSLIGGGWHGGGGGWHGGGGGWHGGGHR